MKHQYLSNPLNLDETIFLEDPFGDLSMKNLMAKAKHFAQTFSFFLLPFSFLLFRHIQSSKSLFFKIVFRTE
jgi:hypothetical protein